MKTYPNQGAAADQNAEVEARKPWPNTAPPLVMDFIDAVKRAAEKKQLLAILTGAVVAKLDVLLEVLVKADPPQNKHIPPGEKEHHRLKSALVGDMLVPWRVVSGL